MKFNIGCGKDIKGGWVNVDKMALPGVDWTCDLDQGIYALNTRWENQAKEIYMSHVLEHLKNPLGVMQELWRVAAPDCKLTVRTPYGSSDNAWEDQTHVRPYFVGSMAYFSQMYYKGADYGYRGDWEISEIILDVFADRCDSNEGTSIMEEIKMKRNMVNEMTTVFSAIKPLRDVNAGTYSTTHQVRLNFI